MVAQRWDFFNLRATLHLEMRFFCDTIYSTTSTQWVSGRIVELMQEHHVGPACPLEIYDDKVAKGDNSNVHKRYPRGSEWRQWDLHIHSPASFHWKGDRFTHAGSSAKDKELIDEMIGALNEAEPAVYAIQDYWNFDGWFALKRRLAEAGAPVLEKTVFPGIELRIAAPMKGRLNAHAIFSDQIPDQLLLNFLSALKLEITGEPVSNHALINYARDVNTDKLKRHGFDKLQVMADDQVALNAGYVTAEITVESYKSAVRGAPNGMAAGFMAFDTNDGIESVKHLEHYGYAIGLLDNSPIFETRNDGFWNAFVGRKTPENSKYFDAFQESIRYTPRLPVSGSDAHQFRGIPGDNNSRGYGDFPSQKITWIKADPTWRGLQQAIKEPQKRCHIGLIPPKLQRVLANKTFYIDTVSVAKVEGSEATDSWFDGCAIPLNTDLVAIIGNKGSGKSALADVLALLGNSQQHSHFSFLRADRFRGKAGEPARHFEGELHWLAGSPMRANLADNPAADRVELVRYVPQGRFEVLCNEHVTGRSENFERELRSVIFSHIPSEDRLRALDFDQLIDAQEGMLRARLDEARKNLSTLNRIIAGIEDQLHPDIRKNIEEQIRLKEVQLAELELSRPSAVPAPTDTLTVEQEAAAATLESLVATNENLGIEEKSIGVELAVISRKRKSSQNIWERITLLQSQFADATNGIAEDLKSLGLEPADVLLFEIKREKLAEIDRQADEESAKFASRLQEIKALKQTHAEQISSATEALDGPQRAYQNYISALKNWQAAIDAIKGTADLPDTMRGLEARRTQLDELPATLKERRKQRHELAASIFDILVVQRNQRSTLFRPLQKLIEENALIRDEYRLQFKTSLTAYDDAVSEKLFSLIKQSIGELRGEEESRAAIKARIENHDLNTKVGALAFTYNLHKLLHDSARQRSPGQADLAVLMRKDRTPSEVYDLIYGFEYLEPKYTLLFQGTQIEQLSPGQRGALLLIFYLLVDKKRNPIILDQPEENLDNETIVSLLVPVLNAAKDNRQIIMVTHNPNLAVVCDAEQIIFAEFDRKALCSIKYLSGSIEDAKINTAVINVLEGTKPAFENRSQKYQ
ncbi:TrlF family AAA-like ATPase [Azospirillum canadense]|uniref:TrlF family AAA-like ATPase n=1 Tax=Azospirillum canadense TaxID=403962 RepID=UPI002226FAAF|nr:AAA family ATPase [Azospirillum canadense]MCW2244026.1 ABC-type lipoprotein export system ATPase subunit [Azospirillum canadense]